MDAPQRSGDAARAPTPEPAPAPAPTARAGQPEPAGPQPTPTRRVRVVLAGERRVRRAPARREIEEQTHVGEVLVRGLIRAQLGLAVRLSLLVLAFFGSLPLLFALAPGIARMRLLGLPLPWLLLGVAAYPFILGVAWAYVRLAERNEQEFADLVNRS